MLEEKTVVEDEGSIEGKNTKDAAWHKRRVKRMKVTIMVILLILLLLPTVYCIYLSLKVNRLENQVNRLSGLHNTYNRELATNNAEPEGNYAYAAQSPKQGSADVTSQEKRDSAVTSEDMLDNTAGQGSEESKSAEQIPGSMDLSEVARPSSAPTIPKEPTALGQSFQGSLSGAPGAVRAGEAIKADPLTTGNDSDSGDEEAATAPEPAEAGQQETTGTGSKISHAAAGSKTGEEDKNTGSGSKDSEKSDNSKKPEDGEVKITSTGIYAGKKVYLTFDDGPSIYTDEILDILEQYGVKATFFVVGKTDKKSKQQYKRIVEEGHALGMHSYSHVYKEIYNSVEDFDKDFTKLWKLLYDTTGYKPTIYRFPGGSGNKVNKNGMNKFIRYLKNKNILYYDWNVLNGDATGEVFTKDQLNQNILEGVASKKRSIVLMHDTQDKRSTVDSLPELLEELINQGAELLPLNEDVTPIQQIRADKVK